MKFFYLAISKFVFRLILLFREKSWLEQKLRKLLKLLSRAPSHPPLFMGTPRVNFGVFPVILDRTYAVRPPSIRLQSCGIWVTRWFISWYISEKFRSWFLTFILKIYSEKIVCKRKHVRPCHVGKVCESGDEK